MPEESDAQIEDILEGLRIRLGLGIRESTPELLVAAPDPVVLFTEALERFQSTMKSGLDELRDEIREFKAAFHEDFNEMIQKIANIESESIPEKKNSVLHKVVVLHEESDKATEEIDELIPEYQVPNSFWGFRSADTLFGIYGIELVDANQYARNFQKSTNSTTLSCACQLFDTMFLEVGREKHKNVQRRIPKSWKFKYKIRQQREFSVILAGMTSVTLHDEKVVELWNLSSNFVYIKMGDSLYDEFGNYIGPEIESDRESNDEIEDEKLQETKGEEDGSDGEYELGGSNGWITMIKDVEINNQIVLREDKKCYHTAEGVMINTEQAIRHAIQDHLPIDVVINKERFRQYGEMKSNIAMVVSLKADKGKETESHILPQEKQRDKSEIHGLLSCNRLTLNRSFVSPKGQETNTGYVAGEVNKWNNMVVVIDNDVSVFESVDGGGTIKAEATSTRMVRLFHGDDIGWVQLQLDSNFPLVSSVFKDHSTALMGLLTDDRINTEVKRGAMELRTSSAWETQIHVCVVLLGVGMDEKYSSSLFPANQI